MKRILFGGSFDPIHNGHLEIANTALKTLGADVVTFIPNNLTAYKEITTNGQSRLEMLLLATKDNPQYEVSDIELKREGISYTIETLIAFKKLYPHDTFYFLMGSDQWEQF